MKLRLSVVLCASALVFLTDCGKPKTPAGQVAATVDGKEVTLIDLRNEMSGYTAPDAKSRKAAELAALDQIVSRKLLFDAAKKQKLDQSPEFVQEKQKVDEALLVRFWQGKVAKSVPAPRRTRWRVLSMPTRNSTRTTEPSLSIRSAWRRSMTRHCSPRSNP
jgi:hypothetical protein